jgi:hypothetical protein
MELHGTREVLSHADDINLAGQDINVVQKNIKV